MATPLFRRHPRWRPRNFQPHPRGLLESVTLLPVGKQEVAHCPLPPNPWREVPVSAAASVPMETGGGRFGVSETLGALNAALKKEPGPPASVWFKESSARNLRSRDFLAPQAALRPLFAGGQVPKDIIEDVISLNCPGVPPLQSCQQTALGLTVQLQRPAAFQQVLNSLAEFTKPSQSASAQSIILNCTPLRSRRSLDMLSLSNLRAILVTDHLAEVLRLQGMNVHLVPAVPDEGIRKFLHQLRVDWPLELETTFIPEDVLALKQVLSQCPYATVPGPEPGQTRLADDVIFKVHLKNFLAQQSLEGYDPNLDVCLVTEEKLRVLAELRQMALRCAKHLVCGPVKVANSPPPVGAPQYFQLRRCQMYEASVMKYGDLVQDDSWTEIISVLTSAAIRFEMLSTAHQSQIILDLEDSSISTKGTKSGAFVMYNCARLATLFKTYQQAVEQGAYPAFPPASELNFSLLREEGEWLLLFNHILPFPETLSQAAQLPLSRKGIRITASTEAVCKFLIHLSMDFSSYYNRVHILGEPLPHLFSQMFARLQLMRGVRDVIHRALATLHLPPLSQI
ncbi:DALR anticodon-binding domain-containing protein 3 isoform X3 [Chrysemys picta bellii]|uniref:DALR anticodon-binding domain-containing protein 3 isoform X3 n=1 Tax=Chrysemys picta bellii TaxID=8478 RepID=UPI0032B21B9C